MLSSITARVGTVATVVLLLAPAILFGQSADIKYGNNWFFGDGAGLTFENGDPEPRLDGKVSTIDGSAVANDPVTGDLIFYTDGRSVWGSDHDLIANGEGLLGHPSSGQPALIVPIPGNPERYLIFTTGAANEDNTATRYSIVDMSVNGGKGGVIEKNIELIDRGTEKITATRHCNGIDYWTIAHGHGSNTFYAYRVSEGGIVDTVITNVGADYPSPANMQGTMQMSSDGQRLAVSTPSLELVELFEFDGRTGEVKNPMTIGSGDYDYYGQEFSPDGRRLYVNTLPFNRDPAHIFQFDISQNTANEIAQSRTTLAEIRGGTWMGGQLQLGPDGKIYVSWDSRDSLAVINSPNSLGVLSDYDHGGLWLGGASTRYGLPNFIDVDLFDPKPGLVEYDVSLQLDTNQPVAGSTFNVGIIICNTSNRSTSNLLTNVTLPAGLATTSGARDTVEAVLASLPAGACDTIYLEITADDTVSTDVAHTICASLEIDPVTGCRPPEPVCLDFDYREEHIDTGGFDYTFHMESICPGHADTVAVLFHSRRYTDTINRIEFYGDPNAHYKYVGPKPVYITITPTQDQFLPVKRHFMDAGESISYMVLYTVAGDTFRIRLKAQVWPTLDDVIDVSRVDAGRGSDSYDTCVTVRNQHDKPIEFTDTLWVRRGGSAGRATYTGPLPLRIEKGKTGELCFSISNMNAGLADSVYLVGTEISELLNECIAETILISDREGTIDTSMSVGTHGRPSVAGDSPVTGLQMADGSEPRLYLQALTAVNATIRVFDVQGRTMFAVPSARLARGENVVSVPQVRDLAHGTYIVAVEVGDRIVAATRFFARQQR